MRAEAANESQLSICMYGRQAGAGAESERTRTRESESKKRRGEQRSRPEYISRHSRRSSCVVCVCE